MGPLIRSYGNKYILVVVDYISKWVKVVALPNNESRSVTYFLKKFIFTRFETSRAIISDDGFYFCNQFFGALLDKYGVNHKVAISCHSLMSDQVVVSNHEIKYILEKTVNDGHTKLVEVTRLCTVGT